MAQCLQLITHPFLFFLLKTQTVFGCRGVMPVEVRCYMCSYCTHTQSPEQFHRSLSCEDTCWADVYQHVGHGKPSDTHIMSQTNRRERGSILIDTYYMRQRIRSKTVFLCVDSTVGASFCPRVFTFETSDKSSSETNSFLCYYLSCILSFEPLIFNAEHLNWANFKMRCLTITPEPQKVYAHLKPPVSFAAWFELQQVKDNLKCFLAVYLFHQTKKTW